MYNSVAMYEKQYLSQNKFDELTKELKHLQKVKRKEIAEKLDFAKSLGDLSENAEYQEARDEQAKTEDRILNIETVLKDSEIVSHKKGEKVSIGSQVIINKKGTQNEQTFYIVDPEEVDMAQGKVSYKSPMGEAMLGKTKGEKFVCQTPTSKTEYIITDIDALSV